MNRNDFMKQLESLLQNISSAEREEALQYYNDYFDDAGPENEKAVIEALGNPAKVAENIKRDLFSNGYGDAAYHQPTAADRVIMEYGGQFNGNTAEHATDYTTGQQNYNTSGTEKNNENKLSAGMIALIVVLCILASPILASVASGIIGAVVGIVATWFSLIIGFGAVAVALFIVFAVLIAVAIAALAVEPFVSLALIGIAFLCAGIGILFMMLTVAMAGIATPAIFNGIVALCRKLFGKKEVAAA